MTPIDASILLSGQATPVRLQMPNEVRAAALENQLRQAQVQNVQQNLKDKQAFQQAFQNTGGDLDKALGVYATFSPEHALDVQRIQVAKAQQQRIEADAQERASERTAAVGRDQQKQFDLGLALAVKNAATPEEKQTVFDEYVAQGKLLGIRDLPQGMAAVNARAGRHLTDKEIADQLFPPAQKPTQHVIGNALVDDKGAVLYQGQAQPKTAAELAIAAHPDDPEAALAAIQGPAEEARREQARHNQAMEKRPVAGAANAPGGLDPDGLELAATRFRLTGQLLARNASQNALVVNEAAKQSKSIGNTPAATIQKQAAFKADGSALTQMTKMASSAEAFESKARGQAAIVDDLSNKVDRFQSPLLNQWYLAGKDKIQGDSPTHQLYNAIQTYSTEYAKIMEGSTGSVAASSDSARTAAKRLIDASQNKKSLKDTLALMDREMDLTTKGYDATIQHINERMQGGSTPTGTDDRQKKIDAIKAQYGLK